MTYITNRNILFQEPFPFNITVQYLKYVLYSVHIYLTRNLETFFKFFGSLSGIITNVLNSHLDLTILALVFTVLLFSLPILYSSPYQSPTLLSTNPLPLSLPILYPYPYQSPTLLSTNPQPLSLPIPYPSPYQSFTRVGNSLIEFDHSFWATERIAHSRSIVLIGLSNSLTSLRKNKQFFFFFKNFKKNW